MTSLGPDVVVVAVAVAAAVAAAVAVPIALLRGVLSCCGSRGLFVGRLGDGPVSSLKSVCSCSGLCFALECAVSLVLSDFFTLALALAFNCSSFDFIRYLRA